MIQLRDHPEIEWCERTGYPSWRQPSNKKTYCGECGKDITDADQLELLYIITSHFIPKVFFM